MKGPRGGGKTFLAAALELLSFRWFGSSATNLGGSKDQAGRCYGHIRTSINSSLDLSSFVVETLMSRTRSRYGDEIEVLAASEKSVRGAHPKGSSGRGFIIIDEAALVPDQLQDTAEKQVVTARPSGIVHLSTLGERQAGRFLRLVEAAREITEEEVLKLEERLRDKEHPANTQLAPSEHPGSGSSTDIAVAKPEQEPKPPKPGEFWVFSYDVFDVAARCTYDCETTCPVKEHFAEDYLESGKVVHEAYCGGKAHETEGHIEIDEIAAQFSTAIDRRSFERELMGIGAEAVGVVYAPSLLRRASLSDLWLSKTKSREEHRRRFLALEKGCGLDWGWAGQTAAAYGFRLGEVIVVYRWEFWTGTRYSVIREEVADWIFKERIGHFRPDGANPSDNDEMRVLVSNRSTSLEDSLAKEARKERADGPPQDPRAEAWDCYVSPVNFSTEKAYGIGEVRRRLEQTVPRLGGEVPKLLIPRRIAGEDVQGWSRAVEYLRSYHYDDNGKPVKHDDHGPDALLCLCLVWSGRRSLRSAVT